MLDATMLENLDALVALATFGTASEAAIRLRITQSAVSKRLAALQAQVGARLVEPDGRRLRLTPAGVQLLERARPLVAELRALVRPIEADSPATFRFALADSVASSWGPALVRAALARLPGTGVELHAHRSVLVIESVRLGRYDVGLCTEVASAPDLVPRPLVDEPLVVLHAELGARPAPDLPLVVIEETSATWRAVAPALRARHPRWAASPRLGVESFAAVAQMARAGFGNGLIPLGLARELELPKRSFTRLEGVARRLVLYARKTVHLNPGYAALGDEIARLAQREFSTGGSSRAARSRGGAARRRSPLSNRPSHRPSGGARSR